MVIDAHSHLFGNAYPSDHLPASLADVEDVDIGGVLAVVDDLGLEIAVTLAQEMTRVRGRWLTTSSATRAPLQWAMAGIKRCISP